MYEQIAQIRILLANLNTTMQALFQENEQLKKELERLTEEKQISKGEINTALWCNGQHR